MAERAGPAAAGAERIEGADTAPPPPLLRVLALAPDARIGLFAEGDEPRTECTAAHAA